MTLYNDDGTVDHTAIECTEGCGNHLEIGEEHCGFCGERQDVSSIVSPHKVYVPKDFSLAHLDVITKANRILDEYAAQNYMLSLRQLYYQFVSSDSDFPNTEQSYKRLGGIITDARLAGLISFERLEDRGRVVDTPYTQPDPRIVMDGIHHHYVENVWADQETYVEVWVEKDALSSVVERPCNALQVPHLACKGYMSASAAWEAGQRFKEAGDRGKDLVLIHLGDHDPSGIDMTRDNHRRLEMFSEHPIDIRRVALNMDQVRKYDPPPNPAKLTDSRAGDYIRDYGRLSWELDALTPSVIGDLIRTEVTTLIDHKAWAESLKKQEHNRAEIRKVSKDPDRVWKLVGANFK